jgi:hypothetical protein
MRWISLPVAISYTARGVQAAGAKTGSHFTMKILKDMNRLNQYMKKNKAFSTTNDTNLHEIKPNAGYDIAARRNPPHRFNPAVTPCLRVLYVVVDMFSLFPPRPGTPG